MPKAAALMAGGVAPAEPAAIGAMTADNATARAARRLRLRVIRLWPPASPAKALSRHHILLPRKPHHLPHRPPEIASRQLARPGVRPPDGWSHLGVGLEHRDAGRAYEHRSEP